jgi:hypothetical protein
MTYGEIKQAIENGDYNAYTDTVDADLTISLFEYTVIRNPKTNECLFCSLYTNEEPDDDQLVNLKSIDVSLEDVRNYLIDESSKGYFSYIGSDLKTELERLDNNHLALSILSIDQWDGWFNT